MDNPSKESTPKRVGAPSGNTNALATGSRTQRLVPLSKMPPGKKYISRAVLRLRQVLEAAVLDRHGAIGPAEELVINRAARAEQAAMLTAHMLREDYDALKPVDRARLLDQVTKATAERDRAVQALQIEAATGSDDPWEGIEDLPPVNEEAAGGSETNG